MKKININKKILKELYCKQNKTAREIAHILKCSDATALNYLKKHNIERRRAIVRLNPELNLSQKELEIILGELLGDGSLNICKNGVSAVFQHGSIYKKYEIYLSNILGFLNGREFFKDRNGVWHMRSLTSPTLTKIYNQWYHWGSKIIKGKRKYTYIKHIWPGLKITPTILLHWYLGDGSLCRKWGVIHLSTDSFSKEEQEQILLPQLNRLGFKARLHKIWSKKQNKYQYRIYIPSRNVQKFLDYIGPCPIKCFKKKWGK